MADELRDLVLRIDADSRPLRRELAAMQNRNRTTTRDIEHRWRGVSKRFALTTKGLGGLRTALGALGAGVGLAAAGRQIQRFQDLADSIDKASQKLEVGTKFLQENRRAAEAAGVEARTFDLALQRLARRAGELQTFGRSEAAGALSELGVAVKTAGGELRATEEIFVDSIRSLGRVEDATKRAALAQKLFDSEGVGLVNLAANYDELIARASALGVAIENDVVQALVRSKDESDELSAVFDRRLAPAISKLSRLWTEVQKDAADFAEAMALIAENSTALDDLALAGTPAGAFTDIDRARKALAATNDELKDLRAQLARARDDDSSFRAVGPFAGIEERLAGQIERRISDEESRLEQLKARIDELARSPSLPPPPQGPQLPPPPQEPERMPLPPATAIDKELAKRTRDMARAQRELNSFIDAGREPADRLAEAFQQLEADYAAGLISSEDLGSAQDSLQKQFAALALKTEESARTFVDEIDNLSDNLLSNFSDTMAQMLLTGQGTFQDLAASFAQDFVAASIRTSLTAGITSITNGGGFFDALLGAGAPASAVTSVGALPAPPPLTLPASAARAARPAPAQVAVNVSTPEGTTAEVTERQGPAGQREIDVVIEDAVNRNIAGGGSIARSIHAVTGTRPRGA